MECPEVQGSDSSFSNCLYFARFTVYINRLSSTLHTPGNNPRGAGVFRVAGRQEPTCAQDEDHDEYRLHPKIQRGSKR
jgi:hypothetical protein